MAFQLAELFVSITAKDEQLKRALSKTHSDLGKSGEDAGRNAGEKYAFGFSKAAMSGIGVAAGVGSFLGGLTLRAAEMGWSKLKSVWSETVGEAQNMARIMRVLDFTFGDAASGMEKWGERTSEATGVAKANLLETADRFGMVALRQGQTRQAAAQFGMQMARLAADVQSASVNTISYEGATNRLFMGMMRGGRGLMQLGISFTNQQVQMKALEMGFSKVNGAFRQTDLQMARVALITKNLGLAQGDLASRQGTAGLMAKQTQQVWANIYEDIGKLILPAYAEWIRIQYEFSLSAKEAYETIRPYIVDFKDSIMDAWSNMKAIVVPVANEIKKTVSELGEKFHVAITPANAAIAGLGLIATTIGPFVVGAVMSIGSALISVAAGAAVFYAAFRIISPYLREFAQTVVNNWPEIKKTAFEVVDSVQQKWGDFTGWLASTWEAAVPILYSTWDTLKIGFLGLIDAFGSALRILQDYWDTVAGAVESACNSIFGSNQQAFGDESQGTVKSWGAAIWDWVVDAVETAGFTLRNFGPISEIAFLTAYQAASDFGHYVKTTFESMGGYILSIPIGVLNAFSTMASGIGSIIEAIAGAFKGLVEKLMDGLRVVMQYALGPVIDAMHAVGMTEATGLTFMDKFVEGQKKLAGAFDVSGVFKNMAAGADSAKAALVKTQADIFKAAAAPPEDVTSERIKQLYGDIAHNEAEHNQRVQNFADERQRTREKENQDAKDAENQKARDEEEAEDYFNQLLDKESRRSGRARYAPKEVGTRNVATEGYAGGAPKLVGAAEFGTNLTLSLLGRGKDYQQQTAENTGKLVEMNDPNNPNNKNRMVPMGLG